MNNINWKVRLHSYTFWMAVISAIIIAIFHILELCNVQLPVSMEETINAAKLILAIPVAIGIIADPTTKGIGDSAQALTYDAPKEDTEKGGLMTYNEFVKAYNGKATDYDGAYGAQCVDLIKLYLNKVFGIKPGSWGNAKYYWLNFSKHSELVNAFNRISNTPSFVPQKGDIMVWDGNQGNGCGHVAICTGEGTTSYFYSYDQNWNGKEMHKVKHDYDDVYGVLRPKDQSKVGATATTTTSTASKNVGSYVPSVKWQNGSTSETVYARSDFKEKIGTIYPRSSAKCFGKKGSAYCVQYDLDGTNKHKVGFVKYAGGVKTAPTSGRNYKNGSTAETVYTDTAKKGKAGSLDKNEACLCPTKTDGMFLVIYKVNGTSAYKCGFTVYDGGVE